MNSNDKQDIRDMIITELQRKIEEQWPQRLESFNCPECKALTLAIKFIPKSFFPVPAGWVGPSYGYVEMTRTTLIGRQCIICKKKFIPGQSRPTIPYIEED